MNSKKTKGALFSSVIALMLCFTMLLGTTFAWFTDSVTSTNNIIKSGTLDVELTYKNDAGNYVDASTGAIFNYQFWEPGFTQVKNVQIANVGNLAFRYQLRIVPNAEIVESGAVNLADVIDVYLYDGETTVDAFDKITASGSGWTKCGTLADLMNTVAGAANGIMLPADGSSNVTLNDEDKDIAETGSAYYTIALHMQESAGNEYQDLSVGEGFSVQLLATQYTWENDSFDDTYDENSGFDAVPDANVTKEVPQIVTATWGIGGSEFELDLNPVYSFKPTETYEEAQKSPYRYYHADFVVSADKDVDGSLVLAGFYNVWCNGINNGNWVALSSGDSTITAGTGIRLVETMGGGAITVNYEELCNYGNDGTGFVCGAADMDGTNVGTTLTVELRLYETTGDPTTTTGSKNEETGNYITVGKYSYTFGADSSNKLVGALTAGLDVAMTADITLDDVDSRPVMTNNGSFDGAGHTLTYTGERNSSGGSVGVLTTTGGTITNLTIDGSDNGRALYVTDLTDDLTVTNCVLDGAYSFNANIGAPAEYSVSFENVVFKSWVSYGDGVKSASFTNCEFDYYLRPYCDTTLTDCTFADDFVLNITETGISVVLSKCYVGDTLVTSENVVELLELDENTATMVSIG